MENGLRHAGHTRDVDAVRAVCAARQNSVSPYDVVAEFLNGYAVVGDAGELVGEGVELVIVGGKKRLCADARQVLDHCPGDGETVVGRGSSSDFVEDDERS